MLEISKMLTLSTAHITKETAEKLENRLPHFDSFWSAADHIAVYDKDDYGWWILVSELNYAELSQLPVDLAACCRLAMRNGCDWLCLDCDGPIEDCLPTYEWE